MWQNWLRYLGLLLLLRLSILSIHALNFAFYLIMTEFRARLLQTKVKVRKNACLSLSKLTSTVGIFPKLGLGIFPTEDPI